MSIIIVFSHWFSLMCFTASFQPGSLVGGHCSILGTLGNPLFWRMRLDGDLWMIGNSRVDTKPPTSWKIDFPFLRHFPPIFQRQTFSFREWVILVLDLCEQIQIHLVGGWILVCSRFLESAGKWWLFRRCRLKSWRVWRCFNPNNRSWYPTEQPMEIAMAAPRWAIPQHSEWPLCWVLIWVWEYVKRQGLLNYPFCGRSMIKVNV